jgi:myo-inositol-1(or 4)-monophosphatase
MTPPDPLFLATAIEVALRAGDIQMARYGTDVRVDKKGAIDLVTDVDLAVERMCRELVGRRFPSHGVLAEELDEPERVAPGSPYCWVFDPIDGTTNYAHGLPIFCASLALECEGVPIVAAVYDPARRELFTAERGQGARLNGAPIRVSDASRLIDALLCTGFPYNVHETVGDLIGLFGDFLSKARAVRRLGSAAIDLCYVAAGRLDGFWEAQLKPWDVAAGVLIVEEAGGRVTSFDGSPFRSREASLVASNGRLHQEMLATIAGSEARAWRGPGNRTP